MGSAHAERGLKTVAPAAVKKIDKIAACEGRDLPTIKLQKRIEKESIAGELKPSNIALVDKKTPICGMFLALNQRLRR